MDKLALALGVPLAMAATLWFIWTYAQQLLPVAKSLDVIGDKFGVVADWLVLLACVVSAGNAMFRYLLTPVISILADPQYAVYHPFLRWLEPIITWYGRYANGFLELQWYMFAAMVLLGASYTMKMNEHVRVDLFYGSVSDRTRHWIDFFGGVVFLFPMCILLIWFTWPWFIESWRLNEASNNAGGLLRWPVKFILPFGFALLLLQGFSEIVKRAAALRGFYVHEHNYEKPLQ